MTSIPAERSLNCSASKRQRTLLILLCSLLLFTPVWASAEQFTQEDLDYWAYQPLSNPNVPAVQNAGWVRNPIDAFILAKLEESDIKPSPQTDRRTQIRRAYFDLIGLPPTPDDVEAFVLNSSPDAFDKVIDQLLDSPDYGVHAARHWLDLVRYADSNGFKTDEYRQQIWRYRDYVIDSFNQDKPYKQFITEQLAGDESNPVNPQALVATGYLRLWPYESNQKHLALAWGEILDDITDNVGEVFLGMGMRCARCHDHKFDPILQKDYYRLRAFFAAINPDDSPNLSTADDMAEYEKKMAQWMDATKNVREKIEKIEAPLKIKAAAGVMKKIDKKYKNI